ncbi:MAG TPA: hemolysin family protein [Tepidisphaeraceae bacterium]|nr:hemolysin family protein [Tepidisphaeraceae bacterium]
MFQQLLLVPLLIAMNAFFVAAEYALIAIRPSQIESLRARRKFSTVTAIERLKSNPASSIGTIQICITMTNLMLGWIGEPAMTAVLQKLFSPLVALSPTIMTVVSTALGFVIVTLLTVVLSELLPKALTLRFATAAAQFTARPIILIQSCLRPLVWVMKALANLVIRPLGIGDVDQLEADQVSVDELRMLADRAAASGVLSDRERSVILTGLTLGRRKAEELMVHRSRVQWIDVNKSMQENRAIVEQMLHTRFPLCDGDFDHCIGVVKVKEFLTAADAGGETAMLRLLADAPAFVPQMVTLDQLLKSFHEYKTEMVFLVTEYGSTEGIVTMRDVMNELLADATAGDQPSPPRQAS